ncbi:AAA family ATPase [Patescibacteria group bacterium]|nr:AAA family ATPase [Patescibacteria group bacterium]
MQNKIVIGLVGEIASGKGTVANYLISKYNAVSFRFSTPLRDVLTRMHVDISRENMQTLSTNLRQCFGQDLLAKIIAKDVRQSSNNIIVVDGIRRMEDIKHLRVLPEFKLVHVAADLEVRHSRIILRGENEDDNTKTLEQFKKDHEAETELEIPKVAVNADILIDNNITVEELYKKIDELIG